jgi:hypothetical protein
VVSGELELGSGSTPSHDSLWGRVARGPSDVFWIVAVSSDLEWKYVNIRRLFIHPERSIDKSTQLALFEPNNEPVWANIRVASDDILIEGEAAIFVASW